MKINLDWNGTATDAKIIEAVVEVSSDESYNLIEEGSGQIVLAVAYLYEWAQARGLELLKSNEEILAAIEREKSALELGIPVEKIDNFMTLKLEKR